MFSNCTFLVIEAISVIILSLSIYYMFAQYRKLLAGPHPYDQPCVCPPQYRSEYDINYVKNIVKKIVDMMLLMLYGHDNNPFVK